MSKVSIQWLVGTGTYLTIVPIHVFSQAGLQRSLQNLQGRQSLEIAEHQGWSFHVQLFVIVDGFAELVLPMVR